MRNILVGILSTMFGLIAFATAISYQLDTPWPAVIAVVVIAVVIAIGKGDDSRPKVGKLSKPEHFPIIRSLGPMSKQTRRKR